MTAPHNVAAKLAPGPNAKGDRAKRPNKRVGTDAGSPTVDAARSTHKADLEPKRFFRRTFAGRSVSNANSSGRRGWCTAENGVWPPALQARTDLGKLKWPGEFGAARALWAVFGNVAFPAVAEPHERGHYELVRHTLGRVQK